MRVNVITSKYKQRVVTFMKYKPVMRISIIILLGVLISDASALPFQASSNPPSSLFFGFSNSTRTPLPNNQTFVLNQTHPEGIFYKITTMSHLLASKSATSLSKISVPKGRFNMTAVPQRGLSGTQGTVVSGSTPLQTVQPTAAQVTSSGFDGLNQQQSRGYFPPDVQMAAGPNDIVEVVNSEMEIFSKSGTSLQSTSLDVFFNLPSTDNVSDVKILYDSISGRWFFTTEDFTTGKVYLAVSSSNDPTSTWSIYQFSFSGYPDQPILGLNDDKLVISVNDYSSSSLGFFEGAQYVILDKNQILSGTLSYQFSSIISNAASIHPVQSLSSTSTLYMVSSTRTGNNLIALYSISGTVPSATVSETDFAISTIQSPPEAVQPGTSAQFDTGADPRVLDTAWYQGKLWLAYEDGCTPSGDTQIRSCIHLTQINTSTQSIAQNFDYGASGYYYFYPAVRIDGSGSLDLIFGYSSSSTYPSLAIAGQATTDSVNILEQSVAIKMGSGIVTQTASSGIVRYGDYFAAAVDPSNTRTVWVAGEYISSSVSTVGWSTFISSMTISCLPPNSGDWTITSTCTLPSTVTAPANVIIQSGVVLTIPNGLKLNIDFAHYHLLVKAGGGVLIKAGGAIN